MAEKEKDAQKRHTMGHPPEHIPDFDSPRSRSPLKKDKKEKVYFCALCLQRFLISRTVSFENLFSTIKKCVYFFCFKIFLFKIY